MPPSIPTAMHAWTHTARGAPNSVLHLISNSPVRHPKKPNELLIKISYAALNPGGAIMMHIVPFLFRHSPAIPEMDFSGVVVEVGSAGVETDALLASSDQNQNGEKFAVGDEVFGSILVPEHVGGGHGTLAEYAVVQAASCVKRPGNARMEEVAGLGVAGCTALVLIEKAKLKEGDKVLINAASGGIGSLVVQLAKGIVGKSGRVVGVCSGRNRELVLGLGADEVVDYATNGPTSASFKAQYADNKFDVVIDCLGIQEFWEQSPSYLKEGEVFVTVGVVFQRYTLGSLFYAVWLMMLKNPFCPVALGGVPRKYESITGFVTEERLQELGSLVDEGKLKGIIGDKIWEMEDVKEAYAVLLNKRARGKIVVRIGG